MTGFRLTAEELHLLAAEHELDVVPGLGPLPDAPPDLIVGTAVRSLLARGLGLVEPDGTFVPLGALSELLAPLAELTWAATAELEGEYELGAWGWWEADGRLVELAQTSPTDYWLDVVDGDLRTRMDEALQGTPDVYVRASRVVITADGRAEGVALAWVDRGAGSVDVVEDDVVTPTGRAAALDQLVASPRGRCFGESGEAP